MGSISQGTGACDGKEDCPSPESVCKTHAEDERGGTQTDLGSNQETLGSLPGKERRAEGEESGIRKARAASA
jgi:hypothetical protein